MKSNARIILLSIAFTQLAFLSPLFSQSKKAIGVTWEYWTNITGNNISNLTSNSAYPNSPTIAEYKYNFEGPLDGADWDWENNYGQRIRAYIHPSVSGNYTFYIASNPASELYLSTDSTSTNAKKIAYVSGYTNPKQWDKMASQKSVTITLQAGKKYYVEALHKAGTGNDHLAVGWEGPNITRQMISGVYTSPFIVSGTEKYPVRAAVPENMYSLSDIEFAKKFFTEINLDKSNMTTVKPLVLQGKYSDALIEWQKIFVDRLKNNTSDVEYSSAQGQALSADHDLPLVMNATTVTLFKKDRFNVEVGLPFSRMSAVDKAIGSGNASAEWLRPDQWGEYMRMETPGRISAEILKIKAGKTSAYTIPKLFDRWQGIWRDFSNNGWNSAMRLNNDATLRAATLKFYNVATTPDLWPGDMYLRQQLQVTWFIDQYEKQVRYACKYASAEFMQYVSARTLAEMTYFILVWPVSNQSGGDGLSLSVPNQRFGNVASIYRLTSQLFPEFYRAEKMQEFVNQSVECGIGLISCESTDLNKDGSGTENAYNYMEVTTSYLDQISKYAESDPSKPTWLPALKTAVALRYKFSNNLITPKGKQILCKGTYEYNASAPLRVKHPVYTSAAFPYHGLYMMRSGWDSTAFFLSLQNVRRGSGHESESGNKIAMEAYNRKLLIATPGEGGLFFTSWAQNTINVDQKAQSKTSSPRHGAYDTVMNGRWYSSARYDLADSRYTYGYGTITNVQHFRQAIFIKEVGLMLINDVMEAPASATHSYQQMWNFDNNFPQSAVNANAGDQKIVSNESGKANVTLIQSGPTVKYTKYYGYGWTKPANLTYDSENVLGTMPDTARGWHNPSSPYTAKYVVPAVEIQASWTGTGPQTLITAIVPSHTETSNIQSSQRINGNGFTGLQMIMKNGYSIDYKVATGNAILFPEFGITAKSILLVKKTGVATSGLVIGETNTSTPDYEFEFGDNTLNAVAPVQVPGGFEWTTNANGNEIPTYLYPPSMTTKVDQVTPGELQANALSLYPNPAKNELNIKINRSSISSKVSIKNNLGQEVYSTILNTESTSIDVSNFRDGIYFIQVENNVYKIAIAQ